MDCVVVECFGRSLALRFSAKELREPILAACPPGARQVESSEPDFILTVRREGQCYGVSRGENGSFAEFSTLELALEDARGQIEFFLACNLEDWTFFHAGAVSIEGVGIVFPGKTRAGKSTLVRELIRAGATYYSDEFAVVGKDGLLYPYPRSLKLRGQRGQYLGSFPPSSFGATVGTVPVRPGLVLCLQFSQDEELSLSELTKGEAVAALVTNSARARIAPAQVLQAASLVSSQSRAFKGKRGDVRLIVDRIFELAEGYHRHATD